MFVRRKLTTPGKCSACANKPAGAYSKGLQDALILLGVGIGMGAASALAPTESGKCPTKSLIWGQCRLALNHEGDCQPERMFR